MSAASDAPDELDATTERPRNARAEVRLRALTSEDVAWLIGLDAEGAQFTHAHGWEPEKLAAALDEGVYASDDRWGWAIVVDGEAAGAAFVTDLTSGDGVMDIRVAASFRGRGVGREVLRQLADHHFADQPRLRRLEGRTHEHNVPMQRAFNAAGFRMEARYRDSFEHGEGRYASEWGYALTRSDWEAGRHRADEHGYDLHGLTFVVDDVTAADADVPVSTLYKFLQEGRRVFARYRGGDVTLGELGGTIVGDVLRYVYVHDLDTDDGVLVRTGAGRSRVQRRQDGRLEVVNEWTGDDGRTGQHVLVERR